ncbi:hypothetical protein [Microvirga terrestris]|uniref:DUF2383 domain-containing protein n=1 Tax=Microvirga terrestris TaxID=2791024 RepID=A0ABS0HX94_9HYPH|nr:hypothetical protein [Microvirga terrestris]MBF9198135.1 hypothetical protein [Microvirga terrestris]
MAIKHNDALVADVVDHQVGQFLFLLEQLSGLTRLLNAFEEAHQQESGTQNNPHQKCDTFENNLQIGRPLQSCMIVAERNDPIGGIPEPVCELHHLLAKQRRSLGVDLVLEARLCHRELKVDLLEVADETKAFHQLALASLQQNRQSADEDIGTKARLFLRRAQVLIRGDTG